MPVLLFLLLLSSTYATNTNQLPATLVIPNTLAELKNALCSKYDSKGYCADNEKRLIIIKKVFDFTGTSGTATEEGCYHLSTPDCLIHGQKKLNAFNMCAGLTKTMVTYDKAGQEPLIVGSNKYIVSLGGGLKGKGLKVCNNHNVFIYGLSITDINPELIWGGDAITLDKATNIWIHGNYFSRIGRQMIVTGYGACQSITISNNEFDGRTPYSAYCDGHHYWLWLFLGSDDSITLYNNYIHHTSGRGAHVTGMHNSKVLLHMITNKFENVKDSGLVEAYNQTARLLMEGNLFKNVSYVVNKNRGHITYTANKTDADYCKPFLGRECFLNKAVNSGGLDFKRDDVVLKELEQYITIDANRVNKFNKYFSYNKNNYTDVDRYVNIIKNAHIKARIHRKRPAKTNTKQNGKILPVKG